MSTEQPLVPRHIVLTDVEFTETGRRETEDGTTLITFTASQGAMVHFGEAEGCQRCYPDVSWVSRG